MNKNYYATIECLENQMFFCVIKEDVFNDGSFMAIVGAVQDFTQAGVMHYLHGHGVPYNNISVKN